MRNLLGRLCHSLGLQSCKHDWKIVEKYEISNTYGFWEDIKADRFVQECDHCGLMKSTDVSRQGSSSMVQLDPKKSLPDTEIA